MVYIVTQRQLSVVLRLQLTVSGWNSDHGRANNADSDYTYIELM